MRSMRSARLSCAMKQKQDKPTVFFVLGKEVTVDDERLATALSRLLQLRREVY